MQRTNRCKDPCSAKRIKVTMYGALCGDKPAALLPALRYPRNDFGDQFPLFDIKAKIVRHVCKCGAHVIMPTPCSKVMFCAAGKDSVLEQCCAPFFRLIRVFIFPRQQFLLGNQPFGLALRCSDSANRSKNSSARREDASHISRSSQKRVLKSRVTSRTTATRSGPN